MISTTISFLASIMLIGSVLVFIEVKTNAKFFKYIPSIVLLYFLIVVLSAAGLWDTSSILLQNFRSDIKGVILPAMIFFMLLNCDLRIVLKLGPKLLIAFFSASITIIIGFIVAYGIMKSYLGHESWKGLAALSGSWMGGTGNMVAVQEALNAPSEQMGFVILTDSVNYSIWFALLFMLISQSSVFDRWVKAGCLEDKIKHIKIQDQKKPIDFTNLFLLLSIGISISAVTYFLANFLPQTSFLSTGTWAVLLATVLGLICAMTPIAKLSGANLLSTIFLYLLVALVASSSTIDGFAKAPLYIITGTIVIAIHIILMIIVAKIFRLNLSICSIASLANIGGIAAAPILAGAYSKNLVPVAIIMSLLGYVIGTGGGLLVAKILAGM